MPKVSRTRSAGRPTVSSAKAAKAAAVMGVPPWLFQPPPARRKLRGCTFTPGLSRAASRKARCMKAGKPTSRRGASSFRSRRYRAASSGSKSKAPEGSRRMSQRTLLAGAQAIFWAALQEVPTSEASEGS